MAQIGSVSNYPRMDSGPSYLLFLMFYLHNKRYTYFPPQTKVVSKVEVLLYSPEISQSADLYCTWLTTGNTVVNKKMLSVL